MSLTTDVSPSPAARLFFGRMVARSTDGHLSLLDSIDLACDISQEGVSPRQLPELGELRTLGWVHAAEDGGWQLGSLAFAQVD